MKSVTRPTPSQCTACGACCFTEDPRYIELFSVDRERLGARLGEVAVELDGRWFLRMTDGHCASLSVDPTTPLFRCAVYELRPDACRAFAEGSRACELIRRESLVRRAR